MCIHVASWSPLGRAALVLTRQQLTRKGEKSASHDINSPVNKSKKNSWKNSSFKIQEAITEICSLCVNHPLSLCMSTWEMSKLITAVETSKLSFCLQIRVLGALWTVVFHLQAALISIGSLSIYQITLAGLCRVHSNIGLEPQREKKTTPTPGN